MKTTCRIWWDEQDADPKAHGWCVSWRSRGDFVRATSLMPWEDEVHQDTIDGTERCHITTLRRRAWRRIDAQSAVGRMRRAFARADWRWHADGYWHATVEVND